VSKKKHPKVKIKKVTIDPTTVLLVEVPKDHVPVVTTDPQRNIVEIAPAKRGWWRTFLSGSE
jgi:hypothetical protein